MEIIHNIVYIFISLALKQVTIKNHNNAKHFVQQLMIRNFLYNHYQYTLYMSVYLDNPNQAHKCSCCCEKNTLERCFIKLGMHRIEIQGNRYPHFTSLIDLDKIKDQKLRVTWGYTQSHTLDGEKIRLKVKLDSSDTGGLSGLLCSEYKKHAQKISTYIVQLNNQLQQQYSEFTPCFSEKEGTIIVKSMVSKYNFISSQLILQKYFNRQINLIKNQLIDIVQNICFYLEIFPFRINDTELIVPKNTQFYTRLKQEMIDIFRFQDYFQSLINKKNEQKQKAELFNHKVCNDLLFGSQSFQRYYKSLNTAIFNPEKIFQFEKKKLKESFCKKDRAQNQVVTSIKIIRSQNIQDLTSGNFGQIRKGFFSFITQISMFGNGKGSNSSTQQSQNKTQNSPLQTALSQYLVVKQGKRLGEKVAEAPNKSIQNEINFLTYMRNKKCRYIARYYCNVGGMQKPFLDGLIYLQYYPESLYEAKLGQANLLKVFEGIVIGLSFLHEEKIIHRDLKPGNIMIDRSGRGKIIDFGSVASFSSLNKSIKDDGIIRSTPGFFIPYRQAKMVCPKLQADLTPKQYYSHDRYDLYSLGVMLEKLFELNISTDTNSFLRNNLRLLSSVCKLVNPNERWTVQQVTIYIIRLFKFHTHREKFWKFGMTDSFCVYDFGQSSQP